MNKQFSIKFECVAKPISKSRGEEIVSSASLDEVRKFVPEVNEANKDLLPIAFNAFVANVFNMNGDGVDGATAIDIASLFVNKPINVEHQKEKVVGVITSFAFTEFESDNELTQEQAESLALEDKPFNITLGGVIWKRVNSALVDVVVESNNKASDEFESISASWEIGFSESDIGLIDQDKTLLTDASYKDKEEGKELFSKVNQIVEGKRIVRKINDPLPVGIGLTEIPAAAVKGVATNIEEDDSVAEKFIKSINENIEKTIKNELKKSESISQYTKPNVKENIKVMDKPETLNDITSEWVAEAGVKNIRSWVNNYVKEEIKKASEAYEADIKQEKEAAQKQEDLLKSLKAGKEEIETKMAELQKAHKELTEKDAERERKDSLNIRIAELEEDYELSDQDRKAIMDSIAGLDDETYTKFKESTLKVLLSSKSKEEINKRKEEEKKQAEAGTKSAYKGILASIKEKNDEVPNSTSFVDEDIMKKLSSSFSFDSVVK